MYPVLQVPIVFIERSLVGFVALGYAALLVKLLKSTLFLRLPFFTAYVAASIPAYLTWDANNAQRVAAWGLILISLRFCVVVETYLVVAPRLALAERRWLIVMLLAISGAVGIVATGYYTEMGPLGWYKAIRYHAHVGFATVLIFGVLALNIYPPRMERWARNHSLIVTLYFLLYAGVSFVKPGKGEAALWYAADSAFQIGILICIGLWLGFVIPRALAPRLPVTL